MQSPHVKIVEVGISERMQQSGGNEIQLLKKCFIRVTTTMELVDEYFC